MATTDQQEKNREAVRRISGAVSEGDLDAIDELTTDDLVVHGLGAVIDRIRDDFAEFHG